MRLPCHRAPNYHLADPPPLQAHAAAVAKLSWAHPEFGSIIASASYDHSVKIWEQVRATDEPAPAINGVVDGSPAGPSRWVERAILTDARGSVRSVEFAPHHFGLKLVRWMCGTVEYALT